jgi:hypothetical protein
LCTRLSWIVQLPCQPRICFFLPKTITFFNIRMSYCLDITLGWSWVVEWHCQQEHLQEFAKFYLANLVFCQLLKR